jgi:Flp pilus assembly protein CpaB
MAKRSNLIVALGLTVFVVGAGATFLIARNNNSTTTAAVGKVNVLYAAKPIPTGTSGSSALDSGLVKTKAIDATAKPADALTDPSQLAGQTARLGVPEGQVLSASQFTEAQTRIGTLSIPPGKVALALQLAYVPGVAGYAGAGDNIDIYGVVKDGPTGSTAKLIMQNVQVLSYNGTALAAAQGQPGGSSPVYLLAVDATAAEQLVYLASFQQLYFALVAKDQAPVGGTPGVNNSQALKVL